VIEEILNKMPSAISPRNYPERLGIGGDGKGLWYDRWSLS